jgi:hypothetical protein
VNIPLTLTEADRFRVVDNRVVRRIFGTKREETAAERRKLHNEELHNLNSLLNIIIVLK